MSGIRHTEEEFQSLLRRLELALDASNIGVWEHNLATNRVTWDDRMQKLYQVETPSREIPAETWAAALHPDDLDRAIAEFAKAVERKGSYESEFRIIWPNGETRYIRSKASYYIAANGDPAFIGGEWDVTADVLLNRELEFQRHIAEERAAALLASQERVEHAANHDYLTGLPNRRLFDRHCQTMSEDGRLLDLAVMHVDLDCFKQINDVYGHAAGDEVLKLTARALTEVCGPEDMAARTGGDEFVLFVTPCGSEKKLRQKAETILSGIRKGLDIDGTHIALSASIGISWGTNRDIAILLKESDIALYDAKRQGRNRISVYGTRAGQKSA